MKKIILLLLLLAVVYNSNAQSPKSFKYQAVVRDNSGTLLANHIVNFRISLLKGSSTGTAAYVETQKDTTNQFGLANLKIGSGILVSGNFANINWGGDAYFVKIELDINGSTSFQLMGTSQLLSVPYALFSEKTGSNGVWVDNDSLVYLQNSAARIGLGTGNPYYKLSLRESSGSGKLGFYADSSHNAYIELYNPSTANMVFKTSNLASGDFVFSGGYIGIGTLYPQYDLSVTNGTGSGKIGYYANSTHFAYMEPYNYATADFNFIMQNQAGGSFNFQGGRINACEIRVQSTWCDYVFAKEYKRMSLKELEGYIDCHKHLPNIPSAVDVETNGLYVGDMSKRMMEKIEELTLYVIDLNKSVEQLKAENAELKKKLIKVK